MYTYPECTVKYFHIIILISFSAFAQDPSHFKVLPDLNGTEPEWVIEMYKDIPNIETVSLVHQIL